MVSDTGNEYITMDGASAFHEGYQVARMVMLETETAEPGPEYTAQELHQLLNEHYESYDDDTKSALTSMRVIWDEMVATWDTMGVEQQMEMVVWFHQVGSQVPSPVGSSSKNP